MDCWSTRLNNTEVLVGRIVISVGEKPLVLTKMDDYSSGQRRASRANNTALVGCLDEITQGPYTAYVYIKGALFVVCAEIDIDCVLVHCYTFWRKLLFIRSFFGKSWVEVRAVLYPFFVCSCVCLLMKALVFGCSCTKVTRSWFKPSGKGRTGFVAHSLNT